MLTLPIKFWADFEGDQAEEQNIFLSSSLPMDPSSSQDNSADMSFDDHAGRFGETPASKQASSRKAARQQHVLNEAHLFDHSSSQVGDVGMGIGQDAGLGWGNGFLGDDNLGFGGEVDLGLGLDVFGDVPQGDLPNFEERQYQMDEWANYTNIYPFNRLIFSLF